jgi:acyl-CoA synthetase (AMP-forming)/AMP-acid ligase II
MANEKIEIRDMIISGGENIYPKEIEEVISMHPAVQMVAVIGVPDDRWGESVKALIQVKEGSTLTEEEMIAYCTERLAGFKKPQSVLIVDSLPLNPAGKILKKVLRTKYWKGKERMVN